VLTTNFNNYRLLLTCTGRWAAGGDRTAINIK
jgi:hypothetical protein